MDTTPLDNLCSTFRSRLRRLLVGAGLCRLVVLALAALPPLLALDWWLHLPTPVRCLALLAYLAALGATWWWAMLKPAAQPWRNEEVLAYLDSALPAERAMLLELYQLIRGEAIPELASAVGREMAGDAAEELAPLVDEAQRSPALGRGGMWRWAKRAAAAVAVFAAVAIPLGEYLAIGAERFFNPFSRRRWPHRTTIALEEPETGWTIPQMEPFVVRARVSGAVPGHVVVAYRGRSTGYWVREKAAVGDDGSVEHTFPEVREPMRFYLRGGDYTTDTHRIDIIERPYLKQIQAHYDYPDYAGIPDRTVASGQLIGLEGTGVRLVFESSMALDRAVFILDGRDPEEMPLDSETTFEKTLVLAADGSYAVELFEKHGFREAKPERYEIRVLPDDPPEAELLAPGRNLVATRQAAIEVALRASDDFGLRSVEFLTQLDDAEPTPLSDRITGPLEPRGKSMDARFTWDLRKMDLPLSGVLSYFVRVRDVNPTGRGVVETPRLQIRLVRPSEFHFEVFERAKRIEAEARVAWESQFAAWELGRKWVDEGTGNEDDPLWGEMTQKQGLATRAAKAMEGYLRELMREYEQNDMARELMAGRLGVITELLRHVVATEHPAVADALRQARPRTEADAAPARLKRLRSRALATCADRQKLAVLYLERLLLRLFDWRDLQTALIRTTLLSEEQAEVLELTEVLAPKTLGWEIEDLPDETQDKLLTLGKRQRTLFDVEAELEKELEFQIYRAEMQERRSILAPLRTAYKGLRENRVNDNLKLAATRIENNQAYQIVKNQKAALHVLNIVKGGLIHAGQKVDTEEPITLAMTPSKAVDVHPKPRPEEPGEPTEVAEVEAISPEELLANLPLGSDPVTTAINVAWEAQDAVLARTRYLAANSGPGEMPRYVALKLGILLGKQAGARKALGLALEEAGKANAAPVAELLGSVAAELAQAHGLLRDRHLGGGTQQIQADAMAALDDLRRRFLPFETSVRETVEENRRRDGVDAFERQFLVRGTDLDVVAGILDALNRAHLLERDVARKLSRFDTLPPEHPALVQAERASRARAVTAHKAVTTLLAGLGEKLPALSQEVSSRIREAGVGELLAMAQSPRAEAIGTGDRDRELKAALGEAARLMAQTLRGLKTLLGERVRPVVVRRGPEEVAPKAITLEEWRRMRSPEVLREKLKAEARLPAEVRKVMLRALSREFPPKYRELLAAYYASFISEGAKE